MKRKDFIRTSSCLILGTSFLGCTPSKKETVNVGLSYPKFDLHTHPGAFYLKSEKSSTDFINRVSDMKLNGLNGAFFGIVSDFPLLSLTESGVVPNGSFSENEGWQVFLSQLGQLKGLINQSEAEIALTSNELSVGDQVKAYIACEGGDFLDGKIENVEEAYSMGVRSIQLVHYAPNNLGDLQTWKSEYGGLSEFGKEVVKKMNETHMLIDVAHASARTVKMTTDISRYPVMLSHSILKDGKGRPISSRAISKDHAKMVTTNGGLIGMWPSGFSTTFDEFIDHTFRMIDAVGIHHVGIGTDMDSNYKPVLKNYSEFNDWTEALASRGLSSDEVELIAGGNVQRLLSEVM